MRIKLVYVCILRKRELIRYIHVYRLFSGIIYIILILDNCELPILVVCRMNDANFTKLSSFWCVLFVLRESNKL